MTIARIIANRQHGIVQCRPDDRVEDAARLLAEKRIGALPVLQDGEVIGIFSERDLLYCVAKEGASALQRPVREVMTSPAISVESRMAVLEAASMMTRRRIRHLPVIDDGQLIAFVSIGDLVKYRIDQIEAEANQMREYITHA